MRAFRFGIRLPPFGGMDSVEAGSNLQARNGGSATRLAVALPKTAPLSPRQLNSFRPEEALAVFF